MTMSKTILGMFCVAISTAFFVGCGATVQYAGGSVLQIVLGSYIFQNIFGILWWNIKKPNNTINWYGDSPNKTNVWIRGLFYWIEIFCWYKALEMVPIGNAEGILFLSPLLTVLMARVLLKERLPRLFPITCMIVMIALVFISQPSFLFGSIINTDSDDDSEEANWFGVLFLILCIFAWTGASLLVRTAPDAHWLQINIVSSFQAAYILTPLLAVINHILLTNNTTLHNSDGNGTPATNADVSISSVAWIDAYDFQDWDWSFGTFLAMFLAAAFEFLAIVGKIVGYQLGEATKVAWMEYFDIVFAYFTQMILFKKMPNMYEWIGAALLITTCIVHLIEEKIFPSEDVTPTTVTNTNETNKNIDDVEMDDEKPLLFENRYSVDMSKVTNSTTDDTLSTSVSATNDNDEIESANIDEQKVSLYGTV